jgi:hypothetical protein
MATYAELFGIRSNTELKNRITAAVAIQADVVRAENVNTANHANRMLWAKQAFSDPEGMADKMMWAILATNRAATVAAITGATDAAVLSAVAAVVDVFATGS